jgi:hypothetical protein
MAVLSAARLVVPPSTRAGSTVTDSLSLRVWQRCHKPRAILLTKYGKGQVGPK